MPDPSTPAAPLRRSRTRTICTPLARSVTGRRPTPVSMDFRYSTALANTGACERRADRGDFGIGAAARIIAPRRAGKFRADHARRPARREPDAAASRRP